MLCAQRPDIHGLKASDSTVILYLHAGEIPGGIGNGRSGKRLNCLAVKAGHRQGGGFDMDDAGSFYGVSDSGGGIMGKQRSGRAGGAQLQKYGYYGTNHSLSPLFHLPLRSLPQAPSGLEKAAVKRAAPGIRQCCLLNVEFVDANITRKISTFVGREYENYYKYG